ncbi:MAG: hypothetical protein KDD46_07640 [Bdellovibrionales bacterium]|nr:hypothetical protein [Bdellovibrionales bacterium]
MYAVVFSLLTNYVGAQVTEKQALTSLFVEANESYKNRLHSGFSEKALNQYEKLLQKDPNHVEALWRASRTSWWIGQHLESKRDKASSYFNGIEFAKRAVTIDPNSAASHFSLAGNYGSYGETKGIFKSLKLLKPMQRALEEVIRIDPHFEEGSAYRVQGIIDYKVPGILGGNKKRAEKLLLQAYNYNNHNPYHLYYLGEYYLEMRNYSESKQYLNKLLGLTKKDLSNVVDEADLVYMQEQAQVLLKKM